MTMRVRVPSALLFIIMKNEISENIKSIISDYANNDISDPKYDDMPIRDIIDSIDFVVVTLEIEDKYGIVIDDDNFSNMVNITLKEFIEYVEKKIQ